MQNFLQKMLCRLASARSYLKLWKKCQNMKKITLFIMDVGVLDQRFSLSEYWQGKSLVSRESRPTYRGSKRWVTVFTCYSGIYTTQHCNGITILYLFTRYIPLATVINFISPFSQFDAYNINYQILIYGFWLQNESCENLLHSNSWFLP